MFNKISKYVSNKKYKEKKTLNRLFYSFSNANGNCFILYSNVLEEKLTC